MLTTNVHKCPNRQTVNKLRQCGTLRCGTPRCGTLRCGTPKCATLCLGQLLVVCLNPKKSVHHKSTYPNFRFSPDNPSPGILQPDCNFGLQLFLKTIKN